MANRLQPLVTGLVAVIFLSSCHAFDRFRELPGPQAPTQAGVSFYDSSRAFNGVNVINDSTFQTCRIVDMEGHELGALPGGFCLFLPDHQYFSSFASPTLYDSHFKMIWHLPEIHQRHDAVYDAVRDWIWVLASDKETVNGRNLLLDRVVGIDRKTGVVKFSWRPDLKELEKLAGYKFDYFYETAMSAWIINHTNSISVVPPGARGAAHSGDLLFSDNGVPGLLYILNVEKKKIIWSWRVVQHYPRHHAARYLPNGEVLFFVNNDMEEVSSKFNFSYSFLARIDTVSKKVVWTYLAQPITNFFTYHYGAAQLLENGNLLVTNLVHGGSAFEITNQGRLVWEWNNDIRDRDNRAVEVYRVTREKRDVVEPYLRAWQAVN